MATEVRVPTLGESVTEATIATWFKNVGEMVAADEMLCELETDKVTVEVPAPAAGRLVEIVAREGETVGVNALLAQIAEEGHTGPEEMTPKKSAVAAPIAEEGKMSGKNTDVMVPALGESVTEATVSTWFKKVGDAVAVDEMLCELETDKVSVEVPSPVAGVLAEIVAPEGATVDAKARLAVVTEGAAGVALKAAEPKAAALAAVGSPGAGPETPKPRADVEDAPSAKKAMAEAGLTADQVIGTGRDGRIMKEDVAKAAAAPAAPVVSAAPAPAAAPRAPVPAEDAAREERVKMTRLRATIARRLKDAQNTAAMLTTYNEVDMKGIMDLRNEYKDAFEKKHGVKLGFMSFFVKACCHALKEVPEVNAEIDGGDVVYKNFVHMGVAVGTPSGLVVPVVRDADQMGFAAIEKKIAELGLRARDGKLSMAEMQGGSFTISNGGVYGSLMSSPILNPPQSGILGMHKIQDRPVVVGGQIVIRPMMYLALSYDHRIVDGKGAVTFLVRVKEALEDPRRLLMDL
ncbi:MAG: 2-oxoglutarate dehydrogenase complex dihydrolipoyllysine-residue succinyltransferase [Rhodobacteraceae bacterium]|jgi:2-oxoglutarate dehydrogenase E2 component (dihydrolipoamide succinyltransferase)|uniref:2-oxoglutarate dehydrogenase complex dihydrolipoyllysine-residue succinyltransferase n=1 Tax=Albidovulum sp. TaxID=1872424 RepID=UPI002657DBFE|nr:2-oxoglutarate dehydrogenase complex dihydrolipoyllysine-residue succinyltransferase [uncultured Defluviimonas sp.]MCC0069134.1 2-oxoglutarate dehydrogenase complex dihydrolipoyllysine-residue succinyltransferase [Paracoccaceae bacterium]